jgi:DNA-binding transcriptional MerR regulator
MSDRPLSQAALGRALGLSPAAINKLKGQGMPIHSVEAAQAWRSQHLNIAQRKERPVPRRSGRPQPPSKRDIARTKREEIEAETAALDLLERRKVLVHRDTVRAELARHLSTLREALLQLPVRLQSVLAHETDEAKVHDLLQDEVDLLLERISGVA